MRDRAKLLARSLEQMDDASERIHQAWGHADHNDPAVARACVLEAIKKLQRAESNLLWCYRKVKP